MERCGDDEDDRKRPATVPGIAAPIIPPVPAPHAPTFQVPMAAAAASLLNPGAVRPPAESAALGRLSGLENLVQRNTKRPRLAYDPGAPSAAALRQVATSPTAALTASANPIAAHPLVAAAAANRQQHQDWMRMSTAAGRSAFAGGALGDSLSRAAAAAGLLYNSSASVPSSNLPARANPLGSRQHPLPNTTASLLLQQLQQQQQQQHQQQQQQLGNLHSLQFWGSIQDLAAGGRAGSLLNSQQSLLLSQIQSQLQQQQQQQRQELFLAGLGLGAADPILNRPHGDTGNPQINALQYLRQQQQAAAARRSDQELTQQLSLARQQQQPIPTPLDRPSLQAQYLALTTGAGRAPDMTPQPQSLLSQPSSSVGGGGASESSRLLQPRQPQQVSIPPPSRNFVPLGINQDPNWITEYHCFVRSDLLEVFQASATEAAVRSPNKALTVGQIGLRCRYCAEYTSGRRAKRSTAFPSSIRQIYQSFTMMLRDHFANCPAFPPDVKQQFLDLKAHNSQGASDSKHYWIYAAQKIGMQDTPDNGIVMTEETKAAGLSMLPYGVPNELVASQILQAPTTPLVTDRTTCPSPFLFELLQHIQKVHLLPSELVGKRKVLPEGMSGLGCRYCCQECRLGFSRMFPLRRQSFPGKILDLHFHLQRCPLCPSEVRVRLATLYGKENPKELQKGDKHKALLDELWSNLLARKGDDYTPP